MENKLDIVNKTTDITESEFEKIKKYKEEGLPGVAEVTQTQLFRMYDLYLGGSTYTQIADILRLPRNVVLYLAHSSNWFQSKQEYLNELQEKIKYRVAESNMKSKEFMLLLVQSYQKKIAENLTRYLSTNDSQHMEEIDLKEVSLMMKAVEMVSTLNGEGKDPKGKTPPIGLNIGDGVDIQKTGEDTVTVTPKSKKIGEILRQHADSVRQAELEKLALEKKTYDISNNTQGESNENE